MTAPRSPDATRGERGTGLLSSVIGVGVVVALVGVAANVALGLWTRSTVDAIAYDAARDVATAPGDADVRAEADQALHRARAALGAHRDRVTMRWDRIDEEVVVLHVTAPGLALLPRIVDGGPVVGGLDRRISLRREQW